MDVATIVALTTLVATFFGGLIAVLKYCIQLAQLIEAHSQAVLRLTTQLEDLSTIVLRRNHPKEL